VSTTLIGIVTAIYATVTVLELHRGNPASALVWGAYALGNIGMIWGLLK